jgi:hypothetical protein
LFFGIILFAIWAITGFGSIAFAAIIIPIMIFLIVLLALWTNYKNTFYAITNKRAVFQSGIFGIDFKTVDFDQITNAQVSVGLFDLISGGNSGTINISSAGTVSMGKYGPVNTPYGMCNIKEPYNVFKYFKKLSFDVKTDISYPNKLRPAQNPGYNTKSPVKKYRKKK